ncbi:hypothetical protein ANRL1_02733 [Anaerolineae bacterium]|nr:hypothetical protein ANRL1_02733 [Anaerolineae bacterium]
MARVFPSMPSTNTLGEQAKVLRWLQERVLAAQKEDAGRACNAAGQLDAMSAREYAIWEAGERLRQLLVQRRSWRGRSALLDAVAQLLGNASFGRGREPLLWVLGQFGREAYSSQLAPFLKDSELAGHALEGLLKGKISGFGAAVRPLLRHPLAWVRKDAKRYLERFS